jgi:hypothetical protein
LPLDLLINELHPEVFVECKDRRSLPAEEVQETPSGRETRSHHRKKDADAFTSITPKSKRVSSGEQQPGKRRKSVNPKPVLKVDKEKMEVLNKKSGQEEMLHQPIIPLNKTPLEESIEPFWADNSELT